MRETRGIDDGLEGITNEDIADLRGRIYMLGWVRLAAFAFLAAGAFFAAALSLFGPLLASLLFFVVAFLLFLQWWLAIKAGDTPGLAVPFRVRRGARRALALPAFYFAAVAASLLVPVRHWYGGVVMLLTAFLFLAAVIASVFAEEDLWVLLRTIDRQTTPHASRRRHTGPGRSGRYAIAMMLFGIAGLVWAVLLPDFVHGHILMVTAACAFFAGIFFLAFLFFALKGTIAMFTLARAVGKTSAEEARERVARARRRQRRRARQPGRDIPAPGDDREPADGWTRGHGEFAPEEPPERPPSG